jgi:hypothetical protein
MRDRSSTGNRLAVLIISRIDTLIDRILADKLEDSMNAQTQGLLWSLIGKVTIIRTE